jgi:hypothetical protein
MNIWSLILLLIIHGHTATLTISTDNSSVLSQKPGTG